MNSEQPPMYALLVGINTYPHLSVKERLDGCVNDTGLLRRLLQRNLGVPDAHIKVLHNQEATRAAIEETFRQHLIGHARQWAESGRQGPPPAFIYHFSGHGSRVRDESGLEPDGLDETTVPYDSRAPGAYDIRDWELGEWLEELTGYSDNVTVILDCCHSGSGTREVEDSPVKVRTCPPDLRPQPASRKTRPAGARGVAAQGGVKPALRHVLLAACRDHELAREMNHKGLPFGALTLQLCSVIGTLPPERKVTYRELIERVRQMVHLRYKDQTPQCEGDRERELFGAVRRQRGLLLTVVEQDNGKFTVDGGLAHGLTAGSLLHAYPPEIEALHGTGDPLATLRVTAVGAVQSLCTVQEGTAELPPFARAAIYRLNYGDMQRGVALEIADPAFEAEVREGLADPDVERYVRLAAPGQQARFRVHQEGEALKIQGPEGATLVDDYGLDTRPHLPADLAHLVRYDNALELDNVVDRSGLDGAVTVQVRKLVPDSPGDLTTESFPTGIAGEVIVEQDEPMVIQIANRTETAWLYVSLLDFGLDWSISLLYPDMPGAHEMLTPGRKLPLGRSNEVDDQFAVCLPDNVGEARQLLKVIATVEEADFEILEQPSLREEYTAKEARSIGDQAAPSALSRLLEMAMQGGRATREGPDAGSVGDQWTTATIEFYAVQPGDSPAIGQPLCGGQRTTVPAYRLAFEPPDGFQGHVRILTERQIIRETGRPPIAVSTPPNLVQFGGAAQLLGIPPTHPMATRGALIEVVADKAARRQVTATTPLRIELPPSMAGEAGLLAAAHDGNAYHIVACQADGQRFLNVESLPDPTRQEGKMELYLYRRAAQ